jgi:hypothetical protein
MPAKLSTTVSKIQNIPNKVNADLVAKYYAYMKENDASERHMNNQLKAAIAFAISIGPKKTLSAIRKTTDILAFLDSKIKSDQEDPEKKWITTWNDYLHRVKRLIRWIHNQHGKKSIVPEAEWKTPAFALIRQKKTKRLSPYSETEIWEREDILLITKYAEHITDKAALTLFWDLDGRNHEVTMLKIKNIRLHEQYGQGEIPAEAKTGSGPILLTCSFTYVRDLLQTHPDKDNPEAPIIYNIHTRQVKPVKPDAMWTMMHERLRPRIRRLLDNGEITDTKEREILEILLKTKRWNPYCIRHSAITYDGDSLPEFALRRKVRWSMNSKQPARYMKRRMGRDMTRQILARDGIIVDDASKQKPAILVCQSCRYVNRPENKNCSKCDWPLNHAIVQKIQGDGKEEIATLKERVKSLQEDNERRFSLVLTLLRQRPELANIKPAVLAEVQIRKSANIPQGKVT